MSEEELVLQRVAYYLNEYSDAIKKDMIQDMLDIGLSEEEGYRVLLATMIDLYDRKDIFEEYMIPMIHKLDIHTYKSNEYFTNIKLPEVKEKNWELTYESYQPYEAFVCNDMIKVQGHVIPQIGYFNEEYSYPCVKQHNREWMLITPNEIETMKEPIAHATGNVATYGLGLGYFVYQVSNKKDVTSVTVVEYDETVIDLFKKYILPQFSNKDKIQIIHQDGYTYAKEQHDHDYIFIDIWHDVSDGFDAYHTFKQYERDDVKYDYWIEKTLKLYE